MGFQGRKESDFCPGLSWLAQHGSLSFNGPGPAENTSAGTTPISFFAGERSRDPKERFSIFRISGVLTRYHSFYIEHHGRNPRLQETWDSSDRPSLISELAGVCKHLGYRNMPLSPTQGGGGLVLPLSRRVKGWTPCFRFQIQCLLT